MLSDLRAHKIVTRLPIEHGRKLVVVDSEAISSETNCLLNQEVFLLDERDQVLWQIHVPHAEHQKLHPEEEGGWPFMGLVSRDDGIYAQRFDGGLFDIDLQTGSACYYAWVK